MTWLLRVASAAKRGLRKIPEPERHDVAAEIRALADDPFPPSSLALSGHRNYRRLKIPPYRVVYRVGTNTVYIFRIEKRSGKTYRGFNG